MSIYYKDNNVTYAKSLSTESISIGKYKQGAIFSDANTLQFNNPDGSIWSIGSPLTGASYGGVVDAFGRLRVSQPLTLFDSSYRYKDNGKFDTSLTGTSSCIFDDVGSLMTLSLTGAGHVYRESRRVFIYQPGKSLLILNTFVMGSHLSNITQRVGYFSTSNGIFLERDSSGDIYLCIRRNNTDFKVLQSNWNIDTLNGNGISGINLDLSKAQIFFIDVEWLGVGSVRTGFVINGIYVFAHIFHHANIETSTYMTTATLPVRYELLNTNISDTTTFSSFKQICSTVISEGGYVADSIPRNVYLTTGRTVSGTLIPLVSYRLKSNRLDAVVIPAELNVTISSNSVLQYRLILNGTLTGSSFISYSADSNVETDTSSTSITGGTEIKIAVVAGSNQSKGTMNLLSPEDFNLQLGRTIDGVSDIITLAAITLAGGSSTVFADLGWYELN